MTAALKADLLDLSATAPDGLGAANDGAPRPAESGAIAGRELLQAVEELRQLPKAERKRRAEALLRSLMMPAAQAADPTSIQNPRRSQRISRQNWPSLKSRSRKRRKLPPRRRPRRR
jgi:hypothetical protein